MELRLRPSLRITFLCALLAFTHSSVAASPRERISLDDGWRFALGHATDREADFGHAKGYFSYLAKTGFGDGPAHPTFDDRWWRTIDLPHDWAVEADFDPAASFSHGFKAIGPGFPESSVGWYRRSFQIAEGDLGKRIRLEFDGVFRDAAVFVNGFFVGQEPSGYLSQSYDVSEYLNYGSGNLISVRVDASMEEGWFYEGAGIYRHVWLSKTDPLHVARDGTYITTAFEGEDAIVTVVTTLENERREPTTLTLEQTIVDAEGAIVARHLGAAMEITPGASLDLTDTLRVESPQRWDLDSPTLYQLVTTLRDPSGTIVDRYSTSFGIREIHFDPDKGFFLNGRSVKLKGTNNHQDHAGVGSAIPDALEIWRLKQLKAMGSNAFRIAHHPASPALLDACDRLGILVIDENRLMGINDYHLGQLERMIRRDRNHPSIILWSVGNEEWAIEGNIKGARIAEVMQAFVHQIEPTRPVTAAISGGWGGISTTIEVMGVNYIRHGDTDRQHQQYPDQIIVGTEETTTQQTRGIYVEDRAQAHLPPTKDGSSGGNAESGWRHYAKRDYAAGIFYWTGFDYRGEPTPYEWPAISSQFGILDTCGFPKDGYYYLRAWWTDEPVIHLSPHWNWPGREGEPIEVQVQSNAASVELFLNGQSLGAQDVVPRDHLEWEVAYVPGALEAKATWPDGSIRSHRVETTDSPNSVQLQTDRTALNADGDDLAVVTVSIHDSDDRLVPMANTLVHFSVEGPGRIIGVGNGNPSSHERDRYIEATRAIPLDDWNPPAPAETEAPIRFEIEFDRPELLPTESLTLYLSPLGRSQTATLNGKTLHAKANRAEARAAIELDPALLRTEGNVLRVDALPFADWGAREAVAQNAPALLGIRRPPETWRRTTFNGLAQVILQSTGEPGAIRLHATADGLAPAILTLKAQ